MPNLTVIRMWIKMSLIKNYICNILCWQESHQNAHLKKTSWKWKKYSQLERNLTVLHSTNTYSDPKIHHFNESRSRGTFRYIYIYIYIIYIFTRLCTILEKPKSKLGKTHMLRVDMYVSFDMCHLKHKSFYLIKPSLSIVLLLEFLVSYKNFLPNPKSERLTPMFPFKSSIVFYS